MTVYRYVRLGQLPAEQRQGRWMVHAADADRLLSMPPAPPGRRGSDWPRLRSLLCPRMLAGDLEGSWGLIQRAVAHGATPSDVYVKVLGPVLEDIGRGWADGELQVAEEHRATAVATRIIGRLGSRLVRAGKPKPGTVLTGAVAGDHHLLPVLMVADILRGKGFRVVDLGADVPRESFVQAAAGCAQPLSVALTISLDESMPAARRTVAALRRAHPGGFILAGGPAVLEEDSALALGAQGWAPTRSRWPSFSASATDVQAARDLDVKNHTLRFVSRRSP